MADNQAQNKDFFINYAEADRAWAEWIAWQLEEAGYTVMWDAPRPGNNIVIEMDKASKAERTIIVLSPNYYLIDELTQAQWAPVLGRDPKGEDRLLIPIRIQPCEVKGLLSPIFPLDLSGKNEESEARKLLLGAVQEQPPKSTQAPPYPPNAAIAHTLAKSPRFPNARPNILPSIWNVPHQRNPFFTGREDILIQLATALHPNQQPQRRALSGLGGIGKTHIATQYAYEYGHLYQSVLWAQADTHETLTTSYITIAGAELLDLLEKNAVESAYVIEAVKKWLQLNTGWLLILDNANDLKLVQSFLPPRLGGHVLLTTRAQAMGHYATGLAIYNLPIEQGALFLLQRATLLAADAPLTQASQHEQEQAYALCKQLGGLPLALDQAGSYIEETNCGLTKYLDLFQKQRTKLLAERRGLGNDDHQDSVFMTFSLCFEDTKEKNPAAADLLRLCAFLAPNAIPEVIICKGASYLGDHLAPLGEDTYLLDQAIEVLCKHSLIQRKNSNDTENQLVVHNLVQAVLQDQMSKLEKKLWIERAALAILATLPKDLSSDGQLWELLVPHVQVCFLHIKENKFQFSEATALLTQTGAYLTKHARYDLAEPMYDLSLQILEQRLAPDDLKIAALRLDLANLYSERGKYKDAKRLYQRSLRIFKQQQRLEDTEVARIFNNRAIVAKGQGGRYELAELLYQRSQQIWEQHSDTHALDLAQSLNNLAVLYCEQGQQAEDREQFHHRLYHRPYSKQGKYQEAERLYKESLAIREKHPETDKRDLAQSFNNLANLYTSQGRYEEAALLYNKSKSILEQHLGANHPDIAYTLNGLALLSKMQGHPEQAEQFYKDSRKIWEENLRPDHPQIAYSLNNLAILYVEQHRYEDARKLFQRALKIFEGKLGANHPHTRKCKENMHYKLPLDMRDNDYKIDFTEQADDTK